MNNTHRTTWIVLLVLLALLCCCCAAAVAVVGGVTLAGVRTGVSAIGPGAENWGAWLRSLEDSGRGWTGPLPGNVEASEPVSRVLTVQGAATLDLNVPVGDVTVQAGPAGQVQISGTKRAFAATQSDAQGRLQEIEVEIEQSGDKVWVRVKNLHMGGAVGSAPRVELIITVPPQTTLSADMGVGRLRVNNTTGDVTINTEVGDVILSGVTPTGKLAIKTRVASVDFSAALAPNVRYEISSDVGRIELRVPAESAFEVDARSDIGDVNVDFPVAGRSSRQALVGKEVTGIVGDAPTSRLYLRSRVGEILVRPGR